MSTLPDNVEPTFPSRRRWFRFSLRTLLIVITLLSLWFGLVFSRVPSERRAAQAIGEAEGEIVYDWQIRHPEADPNVQPAPPGPKWLRARLGPHWFDCIVKVDFNGYINRGSQNRVAVVGPHLAKLQSLRSLSPWGEELDHFDYRSLGQLTQLEELRLRQEAEIRQQDAAAVARIASLRDLDLDNVAKYGSAAKERQQSLPKCTIILPPSEDERAMERAFINQKWGGGNIADER